MDPVTKTFWFIAIASSIVFIVQTIMTFMGADASDGIEADFSGHLDSAHEPFQLLSLRNLVNFLLGFGWGGVSFANVITNDTWLILVSIGIGLLFVAVNLFIMYQMMKLEENNKVRLSDMVNKTAEVYLPIPGNKNGKGKVLLSIKGSIREIDAITEFDKQIGQGVMVNIVKVEGNSLLIVKPL